MNTTFPNITNQNPLGSVHRIINPGGRGTAQRRPGISGTPGTQTSPIPLFLATIIFLLATTPSLAQFIPPTSTPTILKTNTTWSNPSPNPGDQVVLAISINITHPFHINPDKSQIPEQMSYLIPTQLTTINHPESLTLGPVQYPIASTVTVNYSGQPENINAFKNQIILFLPIVINQNAPSSNTDINLTLKYQACDDRKCLIPTEIPINATLQITQNPQPSNSTDQQLFADFDPAIFAEILASNSTSTSTNSSKNQLQFNLFTAGFSIDPSNIFGFATLLLITAAGGFLLNFTPCVLPVIPLKIMALTRSAGSRKRSVILGASMSAGLVFFWILLGAFMAAASGFQATNQLFQYPAFTISVGLFIAIMAISMTGFFSIPLPKFLFAFDVKHDSIATSFLFGIMTAILSTPCTAPFMGSALAWATLQQPAVSLTTFAAIGLGMAAPYMILAVFPNLVDKLPRTGPGSELLKQFLGLLMLAAAAYFIGVGITVLIQGFNYWPLVMTPIAVAGGWLLWRGWKIATRKISRTAISIIATTIIATAIYATAILSVSHADHWQLYSPQAFDQATRNKKIIVLDFTAEWCLNCKALEHTVLSDKKIIDLLNDDRIAAMKVDLTAGDDAANAKLRQVARVSIPVLVIYNSDGKIVFNSDFYTTDQVLQAIDNALN